MAKRVDNSSASKANYPTQLSIAREAGLSRTTVAEILAGKRLERYNDETQRKVFEVAQRLNYRPHRSAQEVRRGRSNLIGVFHSSSPIQATVERAEGLGRAIMRSGFELFLNDGLWYDHNIEHSIEQMLRARVEGIIISGPLQLDIRKIERLVTTLKSANIPAVSVSAYDEIYLRGFPAVGADFALGFAQLTHHLMEQGYRRLILEASASLGGELSRYNGFGQAIREAGGHLHDHVALDKYRNPWQGNGIEGIMVDMMSPAAGRFQDPCGRGSAYMEQLLERGLEADAIVASNDYRAFGMMTICHRKGIDIPGSLAVTGADDSYLATHGLVPITSLRQPIEEMCDLAVETLVRHIKGTATSRDCGGFLPCQVVVRESSSRSSISLPTPLEITV